MPAGTKLYRPLVLITVLQIKENQLYSYIPNLKAQLTVPVDVANNAVIE